MPSTSEIEEAYERISPFVHETPIMTSQQIDQIAGCEVLFKCEHLQKTGSFKARGATNAVLRVKESGTAKGVITHSSGNHGQALAWAASSAQIPCCVVVPKGAPSSKLEAMRHYGARLELVDNTIEAREEGCDCLAKELKYGFVPPYDFHDTVCGQGTLGVEILKQCSGIDSVFLAVGGGGMASGVVAYICGKRPNIKVYLCEPEGKNLGEYLTTGVFKGNLTLDTVADGIRVGKVGEICYEPLQKYCKGLVITVTEDEIRDALKLVWSRLKQRVEPSAAVPLAGLLKSAKKLGVKRSAVILCGGNVDLDFVP